MTDAPYQYVFGPIPSRRLGRSLGIDLVPHKVCPYDCVYCQIGHTTDRTIRRARYVPAAAVLDELARKLAAGVACDYITLSGAGEPTLHADLGRIIAGVKALTPIPVCVLTDGALLADPQVRSELLAADVVCPTLVAADEPTYQRIHRPAEGVYLEAVLDGLCAFRREYAGAIWLEVFLVAGVNDDEPHLRALAAVIDTIRPDRIDINTAVRPPTDPSVRPSSAETLQRACDIFGPKARIVASLPSTETSASTMGAVAATSEQPRSTTTTRPTTNGRPSTPTDGGPRTLTPGAGGMAAASPQPCCAQENELTRTGEPTTPTPGGSPPDRRPKTPTDGGPKTPTITPSDVLAALRRHPSTLTDLAASLNCPPDHLQTIVAALLANGRLTLRRQGPQEFLHCP